eukprot:CAMPEP_0119113830 /NCGR_PEP_ID=MMETSP1180-20130426/45317_1 /TAXON_ID=3052 ORGANISM="Chlamydomonas cf sp, Strain CCMP681" /NCGR_SAMPLE_ID=MMETSP1180 /ASSEMBLY_ACC=CAM_ASM_000741 /LENGTH=494 /DNA_ID=CAMNT_0007102085 /DNA_START=215 /DNA_END=1699 /DNA_ORIENTATION=-
MPDLNHHSTSLVTAITPSISQSGIHPDSLRGPIPCRPLSADHAPWQAATMSDNLPKGSFRGPPVQPVQQQAPHAPQATTQQDFAKLISARSQQHPNSSVLNLLSALQPATSSQLQGPGTQSSSPVLTPTASVQPQPQHLFSTVHPGMTHMRRPTSLQTGTVTKSAGPSVHSHQAYPEGLTARVVQACTASCPGVSMSSWCQHEISVPHIDWHRVYEDLPSEYLHSTLARGYERFQMGQGMEVLLVTDPSHMPDAILRLRKSMQDRIIAIDLEWQPDYSPTSNNKVALLQLSSATTAVLVRTSSMRFILHPAVRVLMADPAVTMLGYGWEGSDEGKLQKSFDMGWKDFGGFLDLQVLAENLGYGKGQGLARFSTRVLGLDMPKNKRVSRSNWAAFTLNMQQIKYAALDVLVAGQVYRGLRLWHSDPVPCPGCKQAVGGSAPAHTMTCSLTGRVFRDLASYRLACKTSSVTPTVRDCPECGRLESLLPATTTQTST